MEGEGSVTSNAAEAALLKLPQNVNRVLTDFVNQVQVALGPDLGSIVLFGSAAEGKLRATSDVNVVVVLNEFDAHRADLVREHLRFAQAAIRLRVMFLLASELSAASSAFAQKFSDIQRRHVVLYGGDPFATLEISRAAKLSRLKQVLMNTVLRLREAYFQHSHREEQLAIVIADAAGPLRSSATTLLELEGADAPGSSMVTGKNALQRVARELGEDANFFSAPLQGLSTAREEQFLPPGVAGTTLLGLIELAVRMRARADRLT